MTMDARFKTRQLSYNLLLSSNSDDASFASRVPTTTHPRTLAGSFVPSENLVEFVFFGTDGDDETFDARVIRWRNVGELWVPTRLVDVTATLSSSVTGVSGNTDTPNGNSDLFADTLAYSNGDADVDIEDGVGDGSPAVMRVDPAGAAYLEVIFDMTGAASGNALYANY